MSQRVAALYAEIDAKTDKFDRGLKGVEGSLSDTRGHLSKLGGAFEELTGVSLGAAAGVAGIAGAVKMLGDSAQKAAAWGDEMGDLAQLTGATVEETSKMAAAFELVGVKTSTLQGAIKGLTNAGLQPNFRTIKALAAEYQAIESPVERNEFLFKKFGRAGLEMAEIMGKSAAELDRLSAAAYRSGKVIGEDTAGAAEEFNVNMAIMQQRIEGAQIAIGNTLIPVLNSAATAFDQLVTIWQLGQVKLREQRGEIDGATAALEMQRIAGIEPATEATETLTAATDEQAVAFDAMAYAADEWGNTAAILAADAALQTRIEDLTGASSDLKFGMSDLTREMLFNQAAAGLDAESAYNLAKSMGLINEPADAAKGILDDLRREFENGSLSAGAYQGSVKLLADAIDTLPDGKTITIEYVEQYRRELNADLSRDNDRFGGAIGDAAGGSFIVPPGYGGDSWPLHSVQTGERVTVEPRGQVQTAGGGDALLQAITALPGAIQRAIRDGFQMAMA